MNERIQELDKQAEDYAMSVCDADGVYQGKEYLTVVKEKFAELLIQQCMACSTWVGKMNTNSVEPCFTAHAINQRIKQQFGIEE